MSLNDDIDKFIKDKEVPWKRISDAQQESDNCEFFCEEHKRNFKKIVWKFLIGTHPHCCTGANSPERISKFYNKCLDDFLIKRDIKRIGNYINTETVIEFSCCKCGNNWSSLPYNIMIKNTGCHFCHDRAVITNERLDAFIKDKNFIRLENVINSRVPIKFKCLIDGYEWSVRPSQILNVKTGCNKCLYKRQKIVEKIIQKYENCAIPSYKIYAYNRFPYWVDFAIKRTNKTIFIEYNGKQHYEPTTFGRTSEENAKKKFINQQKRDENVRNYCQENDILLLELPYWLSDNEIENKIKEVLC